MYGVVDGAHIVGAVVLKDAVLCCKRAVVPDGTGMIGSRVVTEGDIGGTHRVAMPNVDGTAVVSLAALDAAAGYAARQRQRAAVVRINHVASMVVLSKVAAECVAIQVDGHVIAVDVELLAKLDIPCKLNVRGTIGDGLIQ